MKAFRAWCVAHPAAFLITNLWVAVWSANIVTTWAQTSLIQADNRTNSASSVDRWGKARKEWAVRLDGLEAQCARR